jgi:hypothetical protein
MSAAPETKAADTAATMPANKPKRYGQIIVSNDRLQANSRELPPFLKDLLSTAPQHGGGFHRWMFSVSRHLHAHRTEAEISALLTAAAAGCGRYVPEREILEAIKDAWPHRWQPRQKPTTEAKPAPTWPTRDETRIAEIAAADPDALAKLRDSSPLQISPELHDPECLLERLFPGTPLICVGVSAREFFTAPRDSFKGTLEGFQLITPSPMSALTGTRKSDGKPSAHCLNNTGARAYLVVECDQGNRDTQAAVIRHLAKTAPLTMVVDSGGKSLHAWFYCKGQPEDRLRAFFRMAVTLGGDPATWTRSQFVRMPLATRDNGKLQAVHFFNYSITETTKGKATV